MTGNSALSAGGVGGKASRVRGAFPDRVSHLDVVEEHPTKVERAEHEEQQDGKRDGELHQTLPARLSRWLHGRLRAFDATRKVIRGRVGLRDRCCALGLVHYSTPTVAEADKVMLSGSAPPRSVLTRPTVNGVNVVLAVTVSEQLPGTQGLAE